MSGPDRDGPFSHLRRRVHFPGGERHDRLLGGDKACGMVATLRGGSIARGVVGPLGDRGLSAVPALGLGPLAFVGAWL